MYFTDSKRLQRFERDMRVIPNFDRKEVWEYASSCSGCRNCNCKLDSCVEAHCPYIKRKIARGNSATFGTLLLRSAGSMTSSAWNTDCRSSRIRSRAKGITAHGLATDKRFPIRSSCAVSLIPCWKKSQRTFPTFWKSSKAAALPSTRTEII